MASFNISDLKDIVLDSFGRGKASLLERLEHLIDSTFNRTDDAGGGGGLSLGETSGTAYRGDRGKTAYDHSQAAHAPSDAVSQSNTYTDSEIDTLAAAITILLAGKSDDSHIHTAADISDFQAQVSANTDVAALKAIVDAGGSDGDSVVDTVSELLTIFASYPEGVDMVTALAGKANASHTHTTGEITGFAAAALAAAPAETFVTISALVAAAASKSAIVDADSVYGIDSEASNVGKRFTWTNIKAFLKTYFDTIYQATFANGFGITGTTTKSVSLTSASAFATATTSVTTATYMDITGCSVSLAAGTWIIYGHIVASAANAIIQVFGAITHSDNTVISESANSRPASGTASLNSPISLSWFAIVSPGSTTTYKLRGARGLTTHTGSWTAMDGNGVNTANHASNNTDKGTGIFAIRIG